MSVARLATASWAYPIGMMRNPKDGKWIAVECSEVSGTPRAVKPPYGVALRGTYWVGIFRNPALLRSARLSRDPRSVRLVAPDHPYAEVYDMPLLTALFKVDPRGHWWQSKGGALERVATAYEAIHPNDLPKPGWKLVTEAEARRIVARRRVTVDGPRSELDEAAAIQAAFTKRERARDRVEKAKAMVARWSRRRTIATTRIEAWKKRLRAAERVWAKLEGQR